MSVREGFENIGSIGGIGSNNWEGCKYVAYLYSSYMGRERKGG